MITLFAKKVTGQNIIVEVRNSSTVEDVMKEIQKKEGIPQDSQILYFGGKRLISRKLYLPRIRRKYRRKFENVVLGQGNYSISFAFLNEPNSYVTLNYDSETSKREDFFSGTFSKILKEIYLPYFDIEEEHVPSDELSLRIYCGDENVYSEGVSEPRYEIIRATRNNKPLSYYYPRKCVWSILFEFPYLPLISDYGIQSLSSLILRLGNTRRYNSILDRKGKYNQLTTKLVPITEGNPDGEVFTLKDGINIKGVCCNENCPKFGQDVVFNYSCSRFHHGQPHENFDLFHDSERVYCKDCSIVFKPIEFLFVNCYWKYSYVCIDDKEKTNNQIRKESEWNECQPALEMMYSRNLFNLSDFFKKQNQKGEIIRFQVQSRFYSVGYRSLTPPDNNNDQQDNNNNNDKKLVDPDRSFCVYCRSPDGRLVESVHVFGSGGCEGHFFHRFCREKWKMCLLCNVDELTWVETYNEDELIQERVNYVIKKEMMKDQLDLFVVGDLRISFTFCDRKLRIRKSLIDDF